MTKDTILVLVDMNGTVCYRSEAPVPNAVEDLHVRRKYYYKRHGVEEFTKGLVDSGRFQVVVYSSMMLHNIEAGINAVMPRARRSLLGILDREMNKPDPEGENSWDTVRDMDKVWSSPLCKGYGPTNTVLLDNEARKFKDHPDNGIVVPEFGAAEVQMRKADTLLDLLRFLLCLGEAVSPLGLSGRTYTDVREYLRDHPFSQEALFPEAPAPKLKVAAPSAPAKSLADMLSGLALTTSSAKSSLVAHRTTLPSVTTPTQGINTSEKTGSSAVAVTTGEADIAPVPAPKLGEVLAAEKRGPPLEPAKVPKGTSVRLLLVNESGEFLLTGRFGATPFRVSGPVTIGLRVDPRMDYHLLVERAEETGCVLATESL